MNHLSDKLPVINILGPTAAGKTAAALILAEHLPVRLISADSAQVYRGMDIGSAKLEPELLQRYPHDLIDICDPEQPYSVAEFCRGAGAAIKQAHLDKKIPVLVGGTMMYIQSLMQGLAPLPAANPEFRALLEQRAEDEGWAALHAELQQIDPLSAAKIATNDGQRIQRALEVFRSSGRPLSELLIKNLQTDTRWHFLSLVISPHDRHVLHQRIKHRVTQMLDEGFIEEVEQLRKRTHLNSNHTSMRSVGYRQIWMMLDGNSDRSDVANEIIAATRQLAKRQLTWLRQMPGTIWLEGGYTLVDNGSDEAIEQAFIINRVDIFCKQLACLSGL